MTTIKSDTVIVRNSAKEIFSYLKDMNNFIALLPQDKISDWQATSEQCSFRIQGAVIIPLVLDTTEEFSKLHIKSGEKAPFPFTLDISITAKSETECEGFLVFNGEMNTFIRLMAEKPLTNLFNYIAKKLVEVKSLS